MLKWTTQTGFTISKGGYYGVGGCFKIACKSNKIGSDTDIATSGCGYISNYVMNTKNKKSYVVKCKRDEKFESFKKNDQLRCNYNHSHISIKVKIYNNINYISKVKLNFFNWKVYILNYIYYNKLGFTIKLQ